MKSKKTIEKLQLDATQVEFPSPHRHHFSAFSHELRDVVIENLAEVLHRTAPSRDSWTWNADQRDFAFDVVSELKTWVGHRWLHTACTASFTLDPFKGILREIERLTREIDAWRNALADIYKLQLRNIKETQGADALIAAVES